MWMLINHGTRYPNFNETLKLKELAKIRDQIIVNNRERGSKYINHGKYHIMWYKVF